MVQNDEFCFRGRVVKSYGSAAEETASTTAVCISPKDELVLGCHKDVITVWNLESAEEIGKLEGHKSDITCCSVSQDLLATGSQNGIVHLWKYKDLKRVARIGLPLSPITACALSASCEFLCVAYAEGKPRIYTIFGGDGSLLQGPTYRELGHKGGVTDMKFSSNTYDDTLLTAGNDGTIRIWKVSTGECLATVDPEEGAIKMADFMGGSNIAFLTGSGGLSIWNVERNERVWQVKASLKVLACSTITSAIMTITAEDSLYCYNVAKQQDTVKKGTAHDGGIASSAMCSTGKNFVTAGGDGKVFMWE